MVDISDNGQAFYDAVVNGRSLQGELFTDFAWVIAPI
jgi:hypothetical protein